MLSKVLSLLINCHVQKFEIQRKREIKWLAREAQREKERQRPRARDKKQRRHFFLLEQRDENFVAVENK